VVEASRDGDHILITMRDEAPPFDPTTLAPPDLTTPLYERRAGGLGIYLMRVLSDGLVYRALPGGGNELTMKKLC
jgi:serine/threonine-protein kinase RsbW